MEIVEPDRSSASISSPAHNKPAKLRSAAETAEMRQWAFNYRVTGGVYGSAEIGDACMMVTLIEDIPPERWLCLVDVPGHLRPEPYRYGFAASREQAIQMAQRWAHIWELQP